MLLSFLTCHRRLNSTSEATASTALSQLLRTDHVPAGHRRVGEVPAAGAAAVAKFIFDLATKPPSKNPAAPAPFPPTPCATCGPQIRALSLSHLGFHAAQDEHSNGRRPHPEPGTHSDRSLITLVLLATRAAPHLKSMSLANRHSTVATTPASQTTRERDQNLAGAGSKPADFRAPADGHAGATSSLQDRSFGAHTVGGNMTGHHAEEEGRPPYSHVRTMTPAPRASRDGAVAARAGG